MASLSVKALYGRSLHALLGEFEVRGPAEFSRIVYGSADGPERRRVKSHLNEGKLPSAGDHESYLAALIGLSNGSAGFDPDRSMRVSRLFADMMNAWRFTAATQLEGTHFVERDHVDTEPILWPHFQSSWSRGELETRSKIDVVVDFSGSQSAEMGWTLPFDRVRNHKVNVRSRESLFIIDYEGRPRMAMRVQHSPGAALSSSPEMLSIYHDEILWRDSRRIVEIPDQPNYAQPPPEPDLLVLRPITIRRDSATVLFVCSNRKRV